MISDLQPAWDAAIAACLVGHEDCTYGGMTPANGHWLTAEGCELNHGHTCTWCPADATTGFVGWGQDGWSMWQVPACEEHGTAWALEHPEWNRDAPRPEPQTWRDLLDAMNPIERSLAETMMRSDMDSLLYGTGARPDEPGFTGFGSLFPDGPPTIVMPYPKAAPPGPSRLRYDPATKTWEAIR